MPELILASASPRRADLLKQIGVRFEQQSVDLDERVLLNETPLNYVRRLAEQKALTGFRQADGRPTLGADTTVVLESRILGKPENFEDAQFILKRLSGRQHQVMSGVALAFADQVLSDVVVTDVTFREITAQEIEQYWLTGEPSDKAGAYGIQGLGAIFVEHLSGSYTNVVGLPLAETAVLLQKAGISLWQEIGGKGVRHG